MLLLHARRAHMLVTGARSSMPAPEIHRRASVLPRGAGARARHRARGVQQHHSPSEAGRKSILAQRRKGRRARGAGAIFRAERYSVAWRRTAGTALAR